MKAKTHFVPCMSHVIKAMIIVVLLTATGGVLPAFATHVHGVQDFEWHIWSRSESDGHRDELNCGTGTQSNVCALPIKAMNYIQGIPIGPIVDDIEDVFDGMGLKMSIDRISSSDNEVVSFNLMHHTHGFTHYELHCTEYYPIFFWICASKDEHFVSMEVRINDNPREIKFSTYEDRDATSKTHDIKKTLTHELFHAMGVDHNSGSDSIVFHNYVFGENGYNPSQRDRNDLRARYP